MFEGATLTRRSRAMALKALDQRLAGGPGSPATRQASDSVSSGSRPASASNGDATQEAASTEPADNTTKAKEER